MKRMIQLDAVSRMPEHPRLTPPDWKQQDDAFYHQLTLPESHILRRGENGHPILGAYVDSDSNEMVTWGIVAVGEWLSRRDMGDLADTWPDFYVDSIRLIMNSPNSFSTEHWYMIYVLMLSGAVEQTFRHGDAETRAHISASIDTARRMALTLNYDFNQQGFRFQLWQSFTNRDSYRQPDAVAGYAYLLLYEALHAHREELLRESIDAMTRYLSFSENPWYEIPCGSAGLMCAAYLQAHGAPVDAEKAARWMFDPERGCLHVGHWGDEEIDGLMMGWRNYTREEAASSAYSMETLMPLQFALPAVRYLPELADAVARYARCVLSNFRLFYAQGSAHLAESRPGIAEAIPYEKLEFLKNDAQPRACGDFHGQRSVYGGGYVLWLDAMCRPTDDAEIFALDLSLTDWLAEEKRPVFLLRNPHDEARRVSFRPAPIWQTLAPALWKNDWPCLRAIDLYEMRDAETQDDLITITVQPHDTALIALIGADEQISVRNHLLCCGEAELIRTPNTKGA